MDAREREGLNGFAPRRAAPPGDGWEDAPGQRPDLSAALLPWFLGSGALFFAAVTWRILWFTK